MNRLVMIVLSLIMLSGCQAIWDAIDEQHKLLHPEPVLAGPFGDPEKIKCDEQCQADKEAYMEAESKKLQTRMSQPDDPYEYQVQINGKTVTCRHGLNTGFMDGINHNVECK